MAHPPAFTRILLVRHGGTTATADDRFAGSSDVPLSADGARQCELLGERLKSVRIAAAYCSHMRRAIDSAAIIATPQGVAPVALAALREIDHGHWEGVPHREVETRFADEYRAWSADPLNTVIPGGENGSAVLARAAPALDRIVRDHAGQTVLVVSHKATNRLLLAHWLGFDPARYRDRLAQDLACLNIVRFRDGGGEAFGGPQVLLINDTSHYASVK
jgi:probable phosphoglycerate mutase